MDAALTMKLRRSSSAVLPNAPLDFVYPLLVPGGEVEGAEILTEAREGFGVLLFRIHRAVLAWTRRPMSSESPLDAAALRDLTAHLDDAPLAEEILVSLRDTVEELRHWHAALPQLVSDCCSTVQEWACRVGMPETGIAFATVAAMAYPENARKAWVAGKLVLDSGRLREGDMWLRRAEGVARWVGDWDVQVLALNSRGVLQYSRGAALKAERYLTQALRLSQRRGLRERESEVTHDLFNVVMNLGDHERAEGLAARVFDLYGEGHANLPKLAHDTAQIWLRTHKYALALPVLHALLPYFPVPHERVRVLASIVRAAGASRDEVAFEDAWVGAWRFVINPTPEVEPTLPAVLVDLGWGAASLDRWNLAQDAMNRAVRAAERWEDYDKIAEAEAALLAVQRRTASETARRCATPAATTLARSLVAILQTTPVRA